MIEEIWVDAFGFEGSYEVSNTGRVRSLDRVAGVCPNARKVQGKELLPKLELNGYYRVTLSRTAREHWTVHRLVRASFDRKNPKNKQVNHIDGNKANNALYNLEWCTSSENIKHAYDSGLFPNHMGEKSIFSKLKREEVFEIVSMLEAGKETLSDIGRKYGVGHLIISRINLGKAWSRELKDRVVRYPIKRVHAKNQFG